MKLRTSFFEPTVFKKDITRFWPLWGLYSLFSVLVLLLAANTYMDSYRIDRLFNAMSYINFAYALLVAVFLFGDLFKSRMCNALHALPMRRESWFFTHVTAGLLFSIVPNTVTALLTCVMLPQYARLAFALWFVMMVLQYLFFFGVATFACHCSGNIWGTAAIYGIVNFLAVIVQWLVVTFYEPLMYGVRLETFLNLTQYSPLVRFSKISKISAFYGELGIVAGVGVVFIVAALLLDRVRPLEKAGDLIAFKPVMPVFVVLFSYTAGAMLSYFAAQVTQELQYVFLAVGIALGFFAGRMLLERKVRVFRWKNLLAFGVVVGIFFAGMGITVLDPLNIIRYVPESDMVESVTISRNYENAQSLTLTDPEDIDTIRNIHKDCIGNPGNGGAFFLRYELTNGKVVERCYNLDWESPNAYTVDSYFSAVKRVFLDDTPDTILAGLRKITVINWDKNRPMLVVSRGVDYLDLDWYKNEIGKESEYIAYYTDTPEQDAVLTGLFDAMVKDCLANRQPQEETDVYASINITYRSLLQGAGTNILIYTNYEHTIAYLEALQLAK